MPDIRRVGSMDIAFDEAFERRDWAVQRAGWVVMMLVLLAALAGLFGGGPLSQTERAAGALQVEYERFWRAHAPMLVQLRADAAAVKGDELRVWLSTIYLDGMRIQHVVPQPRSTIIGEDRLTFVFDVAGFGAKRRGAMEVSFWLEPQSPGRNAARAGIEGGPQLVFEQFIYP